MWRITVILVFGMAFLAACASGEPDAPPQAVLEINSGGVDIQRPGDTGFTPAENGMELALGDRLRPQSGSNAAIIFFEGSVVFLDEGSDVTIEQLLGSRDSGQSNLQIFQAAGRTLHRVNKLVDAESSYGVRTSSSIGLVRGTNFIVNDSPDGTNWKSVEGDIGVAGDSGDETVVSDGNSSDVPPEGDPSPPIPDPPTPEEQQQLDDLDTIVEEKAPPPPQKDPEISTPVPGPTPTLPPKDEPPPPPPNATAIPTPTNTPVPPAAAPEPPGTPAPDPGAAAADTPAPPPPGDTPSPDPDGTGGGEPAATSTPTPPPAVAEGSTPTPAPPPTPTPVPTPTPLPTVTPLPTITPTPSPTPTFTPNPTLTPTPTLLPTFTPTPLPTETPVPAPPVPHINSPGSGATVTSGTILSISGSGTAAPGLSIDGYSWGYNGSGVSGDSSFTLMVTASGTLTLQVRDSSGVWSEETASVGIDVIAPTPTPTPEPTSTPEPEATETPTSVPPAPTAVGTATPTPIVPDIWVRTDGDDTNCDGLANTAYPGSGTGLTCAKASLSGSVSAASTGNTILFAAGTYTVSSDVNISTASLRIVGDPGTTQIGPGSSPPILDLGGSTKIELEADSITLEGFDIARDGTFSTSTGSISGEGSYPMVRVGEGATSVTVKHNIIRGAYRGVAVGDCTDTCGDTATITDNIIKWNDTGIFIAGTDDSTIRNNDIFENEHGIEFYDTWGSPDGNLIDRNHIHENGRNGIYLEGTNNTIQYNLIERNGLYSGASGTGAIAIDGTDTGNTLNYNTIQNNGWHGIELESGTHASLTISNNIVSSNGSQFGAGNPSGILLVASGSMGVTMTANQISSNTGAGIYIQNDATGGSATGNIITSNTTKALIHTSTGTFTATGNDWGVYTNSGGEIDALLTISGGGAVTITGFVTSALSLSPGAGDTSSYPTTPTPTPTNTPLPTATATPDPTPVPTDTPTPGPS